MGDENSRDPAAVLHDLLTAGTFISYYNEPEKLLDFVAAALTSVPGVAACRFEIGPGHAAEENLPGSGREVAGPYLVTIQSAHNRYGVAILTIGDAQRFQEYQAAVHNLINSVALRLENIEHQTKLEQRIREQTHELELSRAFLESIFENTGDAMAVIGEDLRIIKANRAAHKLADEAYRHRGVAPRSLTGMSSYDAYYGTQYPCPACPAVQAFETGEVQEQILGFPDEDDPERWLAISAFPISDDEGRVVQVIESARDITQLKEAQDNLSRLLEEKDLLLREVYHRVKNNLNLAVSILNLQFAGFTDPRIKAAVRDSVDRISSMARVHQFLYQAENRRSVNFQEFVEGLIAELGANHDHTDSIHILPQIDDIEIEVEVAIPVSLITTELVTNALKYAFPDHQDGTITITAVAEDDTHIRLTVSDDGVGMPEGLDIFTTESLGMQLIVGLTEQIGGTVTFSAADKPSAQPGTSVTVRFPRDMAGLQPPEYG